jgi:hypothetical protein
MSLAYAKASLSSFSNNIQTNDQSTEKPKKAPSAKFTRNNFRNIQKLHQISQANSKKLIKKQNDLLKASIDEKKVLLELKRDNFVDDDFEFIKKEKELLEEITNHSMARILFKTK